MISPFRPTPLDQRGAPVATLTGVHEVATYYHRAGRRTEGFDADPDAPRATTLAGYDRAWAGALEEPAEADPLPHSRVSGYEGMPVDNAVIASLASRRWLPRELAGPREEFHIKDHAITGHGLLQPRRSATLAVPPGRVPGAGASEAVGAEKNNNNNNGGGGGASPHSTGGDRGAVSATLARPMRHAEVDSATPPPHPAVPSPVRRGLPRSSARRESPIGFSDGGPGAGEVYYEPYRASSEQRGRGPARGPVGRETYLPTSGAGTGDYRHVRSIIADYRAGRISFLAAAHRGARAATPPVRDGGFVGGLSASRGASPRPDHSQQRLSSPAPRRPVGQGSPRTAPAVSHGGTYYVDAPGYGEAVNDWRPRPVRGAPRVASLIPERHRYVPREVAEERQRAADAAAAARREALERAAHVDKDTWTPPPPPPLQVVKRTARGRARTPRKASGIAAEAPGATRVGRSRSARNGKSPKKPVSRRTSRSPAEVVRAVPPLTSGTLVDLPQGEKGEGVVQSWQRQLLPPPPARTPRGVNPFGYRKMLVFPTDAPAIVETAA